MLIDWLIDWMIDWLTVDWLIDWNLVVLVKKKVQRWSNKKPTASRLAQKLPLIFFIHGSFSLRGPRCLCIFFFYCFHLACPPPPTPTPHTPTAPLIPHQPVYCSRASAVIKMENACGSRHATFPVLLRWYSETDHHQTVNDRQRL